MNTACHVLNRVLTVKQHNKTCYELLYNRKPNLHGYQPFRVLCTLVKTNNKTKFGEKVDEGYFLGYMFGSPNKRVFNTTASKINIV